MGNTALAPFVRKFFEEDYKTSPGRKITPREVTDWVDTQRAKLGTQSSGATRSALHRGVADGWLLRAEVILPGSSAPQLAYTFKPDGRPDTVLPPTPAAGGVTPVVPDARPVVTYHLRPNGDKYFPRQIINDSDVEVLRIARRNQRFVLLAGPPGAGKTSLVEAAYGELAAQGATGLITLSGDGDTGVSDITGDFVRIPKEKDNKEEAAAEEADAWEDGPLVKAMIANGGKGCVLFVDDATLISPSVMSVIYPAMDGRRKIYVKSRPPKPPLGRDVVAGPDFYVVAAHNPGVPGAILSEALSSRFTIQIWVDTDFDLARSQGVSTEAVGLATNLATQSAASPCWVPQMRELLAHRDNSREFGPEFAWAALVSQAPEGEEREKVRALASVKFGREVRPLALGPQV